jgi:hypothetical protein
MNDVLNGISSLDNLLQRLGEDYIFFEKNLFGLANHFSENYNGAVWESNTLLNEEGLLKNGFYVSINNNKKYIIRNSPNQLNFNSLESKTFSVIVFAMATTLVGNRLYDLGKEDSANILFELFYFTKDNINNILDKEEVKKFYSFID